MRKVVVKLGPRSYSIIIDKGVIGRTGSYLQSLDIGKNAVIITNSRIKRLYGGAVRRSLAKTGFDHHFLCVPDSEKSKSYSVLAGLLQRIAALDKGKRPFIIALGGGVIGDLAGFVAAVYRRGVPLVQIPTTLVAQVDSSIGGKVAIDLPVAKNMIGAFYQPKIVIADISVLKTLPKREVLCGLSEIIKYSLISSRAFFDYINRNLRGIKGLKKGPLLSVVERCCSIKAGIVSADERDTKGIRMILNYGHTVGHALEAVTGYRGSYNHGEAVAVGMIAAAKISNKMGILSKRDLEKTRAIVARAGLPTSIGRYRSSKIYSHLLHDKKFARGVNRFVLPVRIGRVKVVENVPKELIISSIDDMAG